MNTCVVTGTAVADAKLKRGEKTDNPYVDFRLASDHPQRDTSFNSFRVLNKRLAEWAAEYVTKGRRYQVEGYSDGTKIIANTIEFLSYPRTEQDQPNRSRTVAEIQRKISKTKARAKRKK